MFFQPPFEENGIASPIDPASVDSGISTSNNLNNNNNNNSSSISNDNHLFLPPKSRFLSGDHHHHHSVYSLGNTLDDLNLDPFFNDGSKSRKSSGFSDGSVNGRSCNFVNPKSRNCSGESSISQGISGILIPGSSKQMSPTPQMGANGSPQENNGQENNVSIIFVFKYFYFHPISMKILEIPTDDLKMKFII